MTAIFGILNVTQDSFSDGGRYFEPETAIAHGEVLTNDGAAVIDVGAAASNPNAEALAPQAEIDRLAPVIAGLQSHGIALSIDSFATPVQAWALTQNVAYLNDIQGFADPALYPSLAAHTCQLIVMHSVQGRGKAQIQPSDPETIVARVCSFFEARLQALTRAGIGEARIILDPGMGFFLGEDARCSLNVLKALPKIKAQFGRPVLISVSRKAFLRSLAGATLADSGPATLAAELFAARQGADFIRTHDVKVLRQGLAIQAALGDD